MNPIVIDQFDLIWSDEFETLEISNATTRGSANWHTQQPWGGGFSNATFLPDPNGGQFALVEKGDSFSALEIKLRRDASGVLTSGLISNVFPDGSQASPHTTALGHYVEARLWMPNPHAGIWPAFWAIETERVIQTTTRDHVLELDVVEHYAAMPDRWTTAIHDWDWNGTTLGPHSSVWQRCVAGPDVINTGWHVYGLEIGEDGGQIYYFDRVPYFFVGGNASNTSTAPSYGAQLNTQLAWMINLGAGGGWPIDPALGTASMPASMWVDYVRVYKRKPDGVPQPIGGSFEITINAPIKLIVSSA